MNNTLYIGYIDETCGYELQCVPIIIKNTCEEIES